MGCYSNYLERSATQCDRWSVKIFTIATKYQRESLHHWGQCCGECSWRSIASLLDTIQLYWNVHCWVWQRNQVWIYCFWSWFLGAASFCARCMASCFIYILYIYQINQITMRVLSPMWEVALVKSILQAELLIYVAKCLMSFNVTNRTVNQSYSSILYILVEAACLRRASTASAHW